MDISILLDIRGGSPSPRRDPRPPRMLVFKGIDVPQSRLDDDSDYEYGKGLQSYRFPASPVRPAGRFVLGSPASSVSSTYPRSVSSASDTSYHEVDPHHPFARDPGPSSPSYIPPSPSEWDDRWGEDEQDERPAGGVWSPTFGPRPSIDRDHEGRRYSSASRQDSPDEEDGDWDADDSPLSQDLLFERPANSSFKGLDSASSDVPHEYVESQFSPDRRKRSLSHEDVESLPPFHIICWTSAGQERLWTPDDPYSKKILDAYLAEDPRGLEPGIYVWHDELGEESTLHVFDSKTRASREQNEWKQTSIADAKKAVGILDLAITALEWSNFLTAVCT
ncbi:hypothetical protein FRC04_007631 [Tulasnella sp. 424]|nr:hypothetical protein FRC04_007631 [Tulasnella sp. 424]KAG8979064.1 hypothetical protein FRC05_009274 [Tulasnella sp. 425]